MIRKEVAELTVLATEKVARKSLTPDDQKRLVEEALGEVDFSSLAGNGSGVAELAMEEVARVYSEALFDVAKEHDSLDEIRDQLGEVADAVAADRDLQIFFFSPYFSSVEKREGIGKAISGGNPELSTSSSCSPKSTGCRPCSASASASTSSGGSRTSAFR